ncbi:unnamed protein product [Lampetra planeri]
MFHLLKDSPMLALCLSLLEEGVRQLDTYAPFPGKKHLESAVLHCLCLLDLTLQKEVVFMDLLRESQASLLVSPLEQLLQGVSPQTQQSRSPRQHSQVRAQYLRLYLYHSSSNPQAAFQSAKILRRIANYPNIQIRLVGDFTYDQTVSEKLMAGFVECLSNEEGTENDDGVLGCPRSCLHAILSLLQRGTEKRSGPVLTQQAPHLAELCYQVIYQLCACSDTSGPTMRYLRTSQDFLFSHLQHLPFILHERTFQCKARVKKDTGYRLFSPPSSGNQIAALSQMSLAHENSCHRAEARICRSCCSWDFFERTQIEQVISNCEHEVNSILQQVVERNRIRRSLSAKRHALQSWRSLVETLVTACPADLLPAVERQLIIRDLLLDLHDKVLAEDAAGELMPIVAGVVFTLTAHLSQSVLSEQQQGEEDTSGCVLTCTGSQLYYLQIAQKPEDPTPCRQMLALAVLDRILSIDRQNQWLVYICNSGYLRSLVESLRQDDSALQSLLAPQPPLLKPLYIYESKMALLTRVAKTGQGAVELLRCGLVAQLIECQVFDMVPDSDVHRLMRDPSGFIPSPMDRYRQILLPTLRLFQVILTSTTMNHQQGAAQVLQWLIVHADTIQALLHSRELSMGALQELSLLTGIISKTALPGALETGAEVGGAALMEFQGHIHRFQRLCLSLLGRLAGSERERLLKQAEIAAPEDSAEHREEMEVAMQQVCANIMEYCQTLLLQSSAQAQFSICLFSPSGSEPAGRDGGRDLSSTVPSLVYSRVPGLGLVLYLLKNSAADFFRFHQSHRQSLGKLQSLDQLPPEELKELCQGLVSGPGGVEKISSVQRSLLAKRRLVQLINNRAKLLALCSYVIETCLFVLWRHLEYYLLYCTPTDPKDSLLPGAGLYRSRLTDDSFGGLQTSGGRGLSLSRVSQQDLDLLKSEMAAGFGEPLQRKLLEVEGLYSQVRSRYTFIQALVRRIRGLLRQAKS